jgi:O-antigen ligase
MNTANIYDRLKANGDIFVAVSLSTCLVWPFGRLGILATFLGLLILTSRFGFVLDSIKAYDRSFWTTSRGQYFNIRVLYTVLIPLISLYHGDRLSSVEIPAKCLLLAYIVINIERFRWEVLICGVAAGAIIAAGSAIVDLGFYHAVRPGGSTNAIRFGMIALAFGAVSAIGLLHARDRFIAAVALAGSLAGVAAAFISGSRGALLALPVILLLLAPVLWRHSRRIFLTVSVFLAVFGTVMLASNIGQMSSRIMTAYSQISALIGGGETVADRSVGDRTKLLLLSYRLFQEAPLLGVGVKRWNAEVAELANAPDPADRLAASYNQAHNQYADDLAKGGIVRFLLGFMILFVPLYQFLKREPFSGRKGSEFALAGVVISVAFMIFCLSESLMILNLTAAVHTIMVFYLLAACDARAARDQDNRQTAPAALKFGRLTTSNDARSS